MDRVLIDFSLDGSGPLTRSIDDASTSGFIRPDAPHWSIEPYIPLTPETLAEYLIDRGELTDSQQIFFRQWVDQVDKIVREKSLEHQTRFHSLYDRLDPDADAHDPLADRLRKQTDETLKGESQEHPPASRSKTSRVMASAKMTIPGNEPKPR